MPSNKLGLKACRARRNGLTSGQIRQIKIDLEIS